MLVLDVGGMKNDGCCQAVQEAISARDSDATVVIMRVAGRVSLHTKLSAEEAVRAIEGAGYKASLAFKA